MWSERTLHQHAMAAASDLLTVSHNQSIEVVRAALGAVQRVENVQSRQALWNRVKCPLVVGAAGHHQRYDRRSCS